MRFFSKYFICHFYFFWSKIFCIIFTPKTICCSKLFSNFYWFNFWLYIFRVLHYQFIIIIVLRLLVTWLFAKFFNSFISTFYFLLLFLFHLLIVFLIFFIFDCVFFIFCNLVKCFWHIVLILLILSLQLFVQSLQLFY